VTGASTPIARVLDCNRIVTDAITIQNPRNRGGSTGHVLAKRSVTFTEIRTLTVIACTKTAAVVVRDWKKCSNTH